MNNLLKDYIEALKGIDTIEKYELFIPKLNEMLQQEAYNAEIIRAVRNRETYMSNRFSKESATDNMPVSYTHLYAGFHPSPPSGFPVLSPC